MTKAAVMNKRELINACRLLSNMYLCKPNRETLKRWRELLSDNSSEILSDLRKALYDIDIDADDELEKVLWEYTRLFIGPYKLPCPPWESVYTSPKKLVMQEAHDEVRNYYRKAGLTINNNDIMPDHIGAELNFMALLLGNCRPKTLRSKHAVVTIEDFLDDHILKWVPEFTRDMENASETQLYKALAAATRNLVNIFSPR